MTTNGTIGQNDTLPAGYAFGAHVSGIGRNGYYVIRELDDARTVIWIRPDAELGPDAVASVIEEADWSFDGVDVSRTISRAEWAEVSTDWPSDGRDVIRDSRLRLVSALQTGAPRREIAQMASQLAELISMWRGL